jgi:hypothetical protein
VDVAEGLEPIEVPLKGGNMNMVARLGDTVLRSAHPWTRAVHSLLEHLHRSGFTRCPRALGFAPDGREVLAFIDGDTWPDVGAEVVWSQSCLIEAGRLLQTFHSSQAGYVAPPGAVWSSIAADPVGDASVICHNDWAVYNGVYRGGALRAMIDFDLAAPGRPIWDFAYAAFTWIPLCDPADVRGLDARLDLPHRLRLFAEAYGIEMVRRGLGTVIDRRLETLRAGLDQRVREGGAFSAELAGHVPYYERAAAFLAGNLPGLLGEAGFS